VGERERTADQVGPAERPEQPRPASARRPSVQEIADRVYELLRQDLRIERERRGR
jgi:hypothetical protein